MPFQFAITFDSVKFCFREVLENIFLNMSEEYRAWVNAQFECDSFWEGAMCAVETIVTANYIKEQGIEMKRQFDDLIMERGVKRKGQFDDSMPKRAKFEGTANLRLSLENLSIKGVCEIYSKNHNDAKCVEMEPVEKSSNLLLSTEKVSCEGYPERKRKSQAESKCAKKPKFEQVGKKNRRELSRDVKNVVKKIKIEKKE